MKKKLTYAVMGLGMFSFMFSTGLVSFFANSRPIEPNIGSGQVFPLNEHGTIVYLTNTEDNILSWMRVGGLLVALVAAAFAKNLRS
jgi:hypothetical protein